MLAHTLKYRTVATYENPYIEYALIFSVTKSMSAGVAKAAEEAAEATKAPTPVKKTTAVPSRIEGEAVYINIRVHKQTEKEIK